MPSLVLSHTSFQYQEKYGTRKASYRDWKMDLSVSAFKTTIAVAGAHIWNDLLWIKNELISISFSISISYYHPYFVVLVVVH